MKKLLPLVAILTAVSFASPVVAGEKHKASQEVTKSHSKAKKAKHKGKKADQHHSKPAPQAMQQRVVQPAPVKKPGKVWMPSMSRGFQK